MPLSDPILLPPPDPSDSSNAPIVEAPPSCPSDFFRTLEDCIKRQQEALLDLSKALYGFDVCIFNPTFRNSEYDEEDQGFHYPIDPDFTGKVLIKGLYEFLRYGGEDQWSMPEVTLYWNTPAYFTIKENAKIVVNTKDQRVTFRAKLYKSQFGQFTEYRQLFTLVPYM